MPTSLAAAQNRSLGSTGQHFSLQTTRIENFEELNHAVRGYNSEVMQIECGRLHGYLQHGSIGDLPLNVGSFSLGVRSKGILSSDRITLGMITGCTGRITHWSNEMRPADVLVTPPGVEHDGRYYGGASYAVISLKPCDVASMFGTERRLADAGAWKKAHFRPESHAGDCVIRRIQSIVARLEAGNTTLTSDAAELWKRCVVEAMGAVILENAPSDRDGPLPSALRIVNKVQEYVDAAGSKPVHISQICAALYVSRRTLHRAFHDALGMGPVAYLRHRRLCLIHTVLRNSNPATTTVADVAMQHGFLNLGRFSAYYRSLFDEYPAATLNVSIQ